MMKPSANPTNHLSVNVKEGLRVRKPAYRMEAVGPSVNALVSRIAPIKNVDLIPSVERAAIIAQTQQNYATNLANVWIPGQWKSLTLSAISP
jgi:hypothetical protein